MPKADRRRRSQCDDVGSRHPGGPVVDGTGAPERTADVAVDDGRITEVGRVDGRGAPRARRRRPGPRARAGSTSTPTTTARSPGTPRSRPSSWHGVTTVVMGNCGVGFAPVRPDGHDFLIELMEGVEDIPGTALHEGIDWQWETFAEYLDALDATPRVLDVAAQVPHAALRAYVMGERAHEERHRRRDRRDGAARRARRSTPGPPGSPRRARSCTAPSTASCPAPTRRPTSCSPSATPSGGPATACSSSCPTSRAAATEREWLTEVARRTGATVTYSLAQTPFAPDALPRRARRRRPRSPATGLRDRARRCRAGRPGCCSACSRRCTRSSPTRRTGRWPTCRSPSGSPELRRPEVRAALLAEEPGTAQPGGRRAHDPAGTRSSRSATRPTTSRRPTSSVAAVADREGAPPEEVVLDWLLERDGKALAVRAAGQLRRPRPRGDPRDDRPPARPSSACPTAAPTAG